MKPPSTKPRDAHARVWIDALARRAKRALLPDEVAALACLPLKLRQLGADDRYLGEGEQPAACGYVVAGALCQSRLTHDGARQIVGLRLPREFVNLQALLLRDADHDVHALGPCTLIEVSLRLVRRIVRQHPAIGQILLADALVTAAIAQDWIINVGRRDARCRVAHLLCELALRIEGRGLAPGAAYQLPLNQQQIGDAVGLGRVAVNRVLRDLTAARLVAHERGTIVILDAGGLERAADFGARYLHLGQSERDRRGIDRATAGTIDHGRGAYARRRDGTPAAGLQQPLR